MKCTASPRYEAQFPGTTSQYAEEGTLAHAVCELKVLKKFTVMTQRTYTSRLNKLKKDPLYSDEMDRTSETYLEELVEKAMSYDSTPLVNAEVRVDITDYVPEGFGTCDCVMIGGDTLNIVDYKHGKGVPVSAEGNAQMRLYALGALKKYEPFYGSMIKNVCVTIIQPRLSDEPSSETLTVEELLEWGKTVKPIAEIAYSGFGEFVSGSHCRFCRGKAQCKARAETSTALADFAGIAPGIPGGEGRRPDTLTRDELGYALETGKLLAAWYKDLEEYALSEILQGKDIPGWKAVAGRSIRTFDDPDAVFDLLVRGGINEAVLYERKPITLTAVEKLLGKTEFEKIASHVIKPPGKPALVPMSDKREPYNSAAADFANVQ